MSIRRKLLLWMLLVFVVVFGAIGYTTVRAVRSELTERMDRSLVSGIDAAVTASGLLTPEQVDAFNERGPSDTSWIVVDDSGVRASRPGGGPDDPMPLPQVSSLTVDELVSRAGVPFTVSSVDSSTKQRVIAAPLGDRTVLVMARSMESIDDSVANLTRTFILIAALALVISTVAVAVVSRAALRPLDDMVSLAQAVGGGDLSRRIPPTGTTTEVGRLAEALNSMLSRLEHAFRSKELSEHQMRDFLSDASHELRNPITSIRAHAEMYRSPGFSSADALRYAERIEAEAVRMGHLVDDLLLLARLDQGHELELSDVDVGDLIGRAVDGATVVEPQLTISYQPPDERILVLGDARRLRQVVDNLLANVRVHAGARARVAIDVQRAGAEAVVSVTDDGPGVSEDELARVSDRFYRSEDARREGRPGTGLGLSIVSSVVAGHGGRLDLETGASGFTATLILPLASDDER